MNSTIDPLRVLSKIWGADRDGYVFLPWISGTARTVEARRKNYHEGRAFSWPREREAIAQHIASHTADDLYFTPAIFNARRRIEQNVDAERTLWADLDPVDPRALGDLKPTIAWQTSPGRYQGVWLLNTPKVGASWPSQENHRLSLHIGADPSGWDSTQLLRVPGTVNHKPAPAGGPGKLLWLNGPRYTWSDFEELPEVQSGISTEDLDLADEALISSIDRPEVWGRIRLKVSTHCRELYLARAADGDRSNALWEMERELADAGCSVAEIVALVRGTVWNKYAGRNDELKRLKVEAAKAIAERPTDGITEEKLPGRNYLKDLASTPIPRPDWLVDSIWTRGGCGFIAGPPKSYKSWVALDLAVSVSTGQPFLGQYAVKRPGNVLYLQEEDSLRLVFDRLSNVVEQRAPEAFWQGSLSVTPGGDPPDAQRGLQALPVIGVTWSPASVDIPPIDLQVQTGFIASDPTWQGWLEEAVSQEHYRLVVIDTLSTTAGEVDTDRAIELMTKILRPLRVIALKHKTAICIVHHNKKQPSGGGRAGQDMLGSVALHAWVDCALYARAKDDHSNVIQLDRESKEDQSLSLRFEVPHMFRDYRTGSRQLWEPTMVPLSATAEDERPTPQGRSGHQHQQQGSSGGDRRSSYSERGSAGKSMAWKLKQCGGSLTREDFLDRVGNTKAKQSQIEAAIANGFIIAEGDVLRVST